MRVVTDVPRASFRAYCCVVAGLAGGLLLLSAGCSEADNGDRTPLSGTVTIGGMPPDVPGTVYFDPAGGTGVGSSAEVSPVGNFEIPAESGPTPGQNYNVTYTTAPGIPAEGTPLDQIKVSVTYKRQVDVPAAGDGDIEVPINFEDADKQ